MEIWLDVSNYRSKDIPKLGGDKGTGIWDRVLLHPNQNPANLIPPETSGSTAMSNSNNKNIIFVDESHSGKMYYINHMLSKKIIIGDKVHAGDIAGQRKAMECVGKVDWVCIYLNPSFSASSIIPVENLISSCQNTSTRIAFEVTDPVQALQAAFALKIGVDALVVRCSSEGAVNQDLLNAVIEARKRRYTAATTTANPSSLHRVNEGSNMQQQQQQQPPPPPPPQQQQQQQSIPQVKSRVRVSGVAWSGTGSIDNPNDKDQVMYDSLLDEFGKMAKMKHQQRENEFVAEMNRVNQSQQTSSAASTTVNPSPIRVDTTAKPLPTHTDRYNNGTNEINRNNGVHANNIPSSAGATEPKKTETHRSSIDDIKREDFILQNAIIEDIFDGGDCDRVVVDFSSFFRKGEGILVGSSLDLMVLVLSDSYSIKSNHIQISSPYSAPIVEKYSSSTNTTNTNPRLSPRSISRQNNCFPFRISVGAVHSYVILADGTPTFASMLRPGDAVLVFNRDGPVRTATVGRVSFESKPLSIVHISCNYSPSLSSGSSSTTAANDFRVESDVFIENDATVFLSKDEHNRVKYLSINDGDVRGMTILSRLSSEYVNGKRNRRSSYYANTSHDVNPPTGYRGGAE